MEYLVHKTNTSSQPIPFQIVRQSYQLEGTITSIHSSFLTANDIDFITEALHERINVLFASIKEDKVIFVNPYNANYFIYDSFAKLPLEDIITKLNEAPSTPYSNCYTEVISDTTLNLVGA